MTNSGVAHLTHLAGFFFAGLYLAIRLNRNILAILMGRREDDDYY
jgi:membrane associated rhomboid family serine protease